MSLGSNRQARGVTIFGTDRVYDSLKEETEKVSIAVSNIQSGSLSTLSEPVANNDATVVSVTPPQPVLSISSNRSVNLNGNPIVNAANISSQSLDTNSATVSSLVFKGSSGLGFNNPLNGPIVRADRPRVGYTAVIQSESIPGSRTSSTLFTRTADTWTSGALVGQWAYTFESGKPQFGSYSLISANDATTITISGTIGATANTVMITNYNPIVLSVSTGVQHRTVQWLDGSRFLYSISSSGFCSVDRVTLARTVMSASYALTYRELLFDGQNIWICPLTSSDFVRYNSSTGTFTSYAHGLSSPNFQAFCYDSLNNRIWFTYSSSTPGVYFLQCETGVVSQFTTDFVISFVQAMCFDGESIWIILNQKYYKINIVSLAITETTATIFSGGTPVGAIFDGQNIWTTITSGEKYFRINVNSGVITLFNAPSGWAVRASNGCWGGESIWFTCSGSSTHGGVFRVNPVTGAIQGINICQTTGAGANTGNLLCADGEHIYACSLSSGANGNAVKIRSPRFGVQDYCNQGTVVTNNLAVSGGVASTSATSGAVVVSGGVGVGGAVYSTGGFQGPIGNVVKNTAAFTSLSADTAVLPRATTIAGSQGINGVSPWRDQIHCGRSSNNYVGNNGNQCAFYTQLSIGALIGGTRTSATVFTRSSGTWVANSLAGQWAYSQASSVQNATAGVWSQIVSNTDTTLTVSTPILNATGSGITVSNFRPFNKHVSLGSGAANLRGGVWDGSLLWCIGNNGNIVRYNPTTDQIQLTSHSLGDLCDIIYDKSTFFWTANVSGSNLYRINRETLAVSTFSLGTTIACAGLVFDGQMIWMVPSTGTNVYRFDTVTYTLTDNGAHGATADSASQFFYSGVFDGESVWCVGAALLKINVSTYTMTLSAISGTRSLAGVAFTGVGLIAMPVQTGASTTNVSRINIENSTIVTTGVGLTAGQTSHKSACFDGSHVWFAPWNGSFLTAFNPRTNRFFHYPLGTTSYAGYTVTNPFSSIVFTGEELIMIPQDFNSFWVLRPPYLGSEDQAVSKDLSVGRSVVLKANGSGNTVTVAAPALSSSYGLTLPTSAGSSGQVLSTNGSGVTSWVANGSGGYDANAVAITGGSIAGVNASFGDVSAYGKYSEGSVAINNALTPLNDIPFSTSIVYTLYSNETVINGLASIGVVDGQRVRFISRIANVTINHESTSASTTAGRIITVTGSAVRLLAPFSCLFLYSGIDSRWQLIEEYSANLNGSTVRSNSYVEMKAGTGTNYLRLQHNAGSAAAYTLTYPAAAPTANSQLVSTDTGGTLAWQSVFNPAIPGVIGNTTPNTVKATNLTTTSTTFLTNTNGSIGTNYATVSFNIASTGESTLLTESFADTWKFLIDFELIICDDSGTTPAFDIGIVKGQISAIEITTRKVALRIENVMKDTTATGADLGLTFTASSVFFTLSLKCTNSTGKAMKGIIHYRKLQLY